MANIKALYDVPNRELPNLRKHELIALVEHLRTEVETFNYLYPRALEQTERVKAICKRAGGLVGDSVADIVTDYVEKLEQQIEKLR